MRWPLTLLSVLTLAALLTGCHSNEKVERELRARDGDLRELRDELDRSEFYNKALQAELNGMRGEYCPMPGASDKPAPIYPIRSLTLGRQTGGYDTGNCSGDNALQVVLEPRDVDNHAIKVPASALIQVVEISPEGLKKPLSSWEIGADQLRNSWRQGLLTTGYVLVLPWKVYPSYPKLRVIAQLQVADGRLYEADKDVTVRVVPPAQRKNVVPEDRPAGAPDDPLFPMPKASDKVMPQVPDNLPPAEPIPAPKAPPEKLPAPVPAGIGPVLPPPPAIVPDKTTASWGTPTTKSNAAWGPPSSFKPDLPAVQMDRPTPGRSGW